MLYINVYLKILLLNQIYIYSNELAINYDKNDMNYLKLNTIFTAIVPSILFIISFIFYLVALTNNSKIIHFYIVILLCFIIYCI